MAMKSLWPSWTDRGTIEIRSLWSLVPLVPCRDNFASMWSTVPNFATVSKYLLCTYIAPRDIGTYFCVWPFPLWNTCADNTAVLMYYCFGLWQVTWCSSPALMCNRCNTILGGLRFACISRHEKVRIEVDQCIGQPLPQYTGFGILYDLLWLHYMYSWMVLTIRVSVLHGHFWVYPSTPWLERLIGN